MVWILVFESRSCWYWVLVAGCECVCCTSQKTRANKGESNKEEPSYLFGSSNLIVVDVPLVAFFFLYPTRSIINSKKNVFVDVYVPLIAKWCNSSAGCSNPSGLVGEYKLLSTD